MRRGPAAETWRCFVAVPIDDELRTILARAVSGWQGRPELGALRWADADAWHVTLAFIGAVPVDRVEQLIAVVRRVAEDTSGFTLETGGVGAFPSARRARVAWCGVRDDGRLTAVARDLRRDLHVEGSPFRAHLTLARSKGRADVDLREWLAEANAPEGRLVVDRLAVMRSHLGRGPARYETLAAASLAMASRV